MVIDFAKVAGGGVQPTGTINISQNGSYDVTEYAGAEVSVESSAKPEESLSETLTENSTYVFSPTPGSVFSDVTVSVSVPSDQKPEEQLNVTLSANGDYSYSPTPGSVYSDVTVSVSVSGGITPTGTINISSNGTFDVTSYASAAVSVSGGVTPSGTLPIYANGDYDVTSYASVAVSVPGGGQDYRYMNGVITGLEDLGWDADSIGYANYNCEPHYSYENDKYVVTSDNKALYGLVDASTFASYKSDPNMVYLPYFDTSSMTDLTFATSSVKAIPILDYSGMSSTNQIFRNSKLAYISPVTLKGEIFNTFMGCKNLKSLKINSIDISTGSTFANMFKDCESLEYVPFFDTQFANNMASMFEGCKKLKSVPKYNTSNVTNAQLMFKNCISLETIPDFDFSAVTTIGHLFNMSDATTRDNIALKYVPDLHTTNGVLQRVNSAFAGCNNLETVENLNTAGVTNPTFFQHMFDGCNNLKHIKGLDFSGLTSQPNIMDYSTGVYYSIEEFIVKGSLNFSWDSPVDGAAPISNMFAKTGYDSVKSLLTAMDNTTDPTTPKTMILNKVMYDNNGELQTLVDDCVNNKGWSIPNLIIDANPYTISYTTTSGEKLWPDYDKWISGFGSGRFYYSDYDGINGGTFYFYGSPTVIPNALFKDNTDLRGIDLSLPSITTISENAFSGCKGMIYGSVTLGSGLTTIGDYAFYDCNSVGRWTIPANVTSIGELAFGQHDLINRTKEFHILATVPPTLTGTNPANTFGVLKSDSKIYVPTGTLQDYLNDTAWANFQQWLVEE